MLQPESTAAFLFACTGAIAHGSRVKIRLRHPGGWWVDRIPAWIKWATGESAFCTACLLTAHSLAHTHTHMRTPHSLGSYSYTRACSSSAPQLSCIFLFLFLEPSAQSFLLLLRTVIYCTVLLGCLSLYCLQYHRA